MPRPLYKIHTLATRTTLSGDTLKVWFVSVSYNDLATALDDQQRIEYVIGKPCRIVPSNPAGGDR